MGYGIKIKQYRIRAGYTLTEAAKLVGTTPVSLSRYENDTIEIPVTVLVKLARLYKFDVFPVIGVETGDKGMLDEEFVLLLETHCWYVAEMERERNISFGNILPEDYYTKRYRELLDAEKGSFPSTDQSRRRSE